MGKREDRETEQQEIRNKIASNVHEFQFLRCKAAAVFEKIDHNYNPYFYRDLRPLFERMLEISTFLDSHLHNT